MKLECRLYRKNNKTLWRVQNVESINDFWLALEIVVSVPSKLVMESQGVLAGWLVCEGEVHERRGDTVYETLKIERR